MVHDPHAHHRHAAGDHSACAASESDPAPAHSCCGGDHGAAAPGRDGSFDTVPPGFAGAVYTCPMHPQVRAPGPGPCPLCGMALEPEDPAQAADDSELRDMTRRFLVCAAFTVPLFVLAMGEMAPGWPLAGMPPAVSRWLQLGLAAPVVLWGAWPFFARAAASVRTMRLNMFTLIGLGVAAAFGWSLAATLAPGLFPPSTHSMGHGPGVYYEAAAVITTLVLLGQVLELRARAGASGAIRALLALTPPTARRIAPDGTEADVAVDEIQAGDRLRVRPGEKIPVDGSIETGAGVLDESLLTGESMPLSRAAGDRVIAGAVNQGEGGFVMRAERVGRDTMLAGVVRMVAQAQRSRAPIQRLADRVAAWFTPAVIAVAILAFVVWALVGPAPALAHALAAAVSVLIIACPCALGLATPMSIMVGVGRGARAGVLIRDAAALETLEKADVLLVDKTGTLTEGRPELVLLHAEPGFGEEEALRVAAALEAGSEHPTAAAIMRAAQERGLRPPEAEDFAAVTGQGVRGVVDGRAAILGNRILMQTGFAPPQDWLDRAEAARADGRSVVFLAIDSRPAALIGVADRIKATTPEALRLLRADGMRVIMATGDSETTARAVARTLGIDEVHAEASPADKHDLIAALQAEGRVVAMAGDGVNDAPALARADVGIAMGTGADIAMQSAGVTLTHGDLRAVARARRLSRATMRNIRQNLTFAFAYNGLGVPVAAGALYPVFGLLLSPMIAAAAMSLSSVSVIANALRLRRAPL